MSQSLPPKPSLEHLKKQAKELQAAYRQNQPDAQKAVAPYFPTGSILSLVQAQLVLAREYGFPSWKQLSRHVEGSHGSLDEFVETALGGQIERAKELWRTRGSALRLSPAASALAGDHEALRDALKADPSLANRPNGPKDRSLLGYTCFSRLIADPEFEAPILQTADLLLKAGADPNGFYLAEWAGEMWPQTPIYGAAGVVNHSELTKRLLDAGADPNEGAQDAAPYKGEALYHACDHPGHNECLRLLLEAGVGQGGRDFCLLRKLDFEDPEGVLLFLAHGANPNRPGIRSALGHALLRNRSVDMIRLLLDRGADPNARDADGSTPYVLARRYGNREAAELLAERMTTIEISDYDALLIAAADGEPERVKEIAKAHPEVLTKLGGYGRQPEDGMALGATGEILQDLARAGQVAGLAALIDIGMDPGFENYYNETPLHWACVAGRVEAAKLLVERGCPLDIREKNHNADAIGWACWGSQYWNDPHGDYVATVRYMLDAGATAPSGPVGSAEVRELLRERGA